MITNNSLQEKASFILFAILSVLLPFHHKYIAYIIGLLLVIQFFNFSLNKLKRLYQNKLFLLSIIFYLLHVVSYFFSEDKNRAGFDLEVKLSLIVFPLIFALDDNRHYQKLTPFFLSGIWFSILLNYSLSTISFIKTGNSHHYTYIYFSHFMHPTYYSMFLNMGVLFLYKQIRQTQNLKLKLFSLLQICGITTTVFLISSKTGILALFIIFIFFFIRFFFSKKAGIYLKIASILPLLFITTLLVSNSRMQVFYNRLTKSGSEINSHSPSRHKIWFSSINLIKQNLLFGTGIGDSQNELIKEYKKNNFVSEANKKLNCHNQFLQSFLGLGIAGICLLLLLLFYSFKNALQQKELLYLIFCCLLIVYFFTESILETRAGNLFYTFFLGALPSFKEKKLN